MDYNDVIYYKQYAPTGLKDIFKYLLVRLPYTCEVWYTYNLLNINTLSVFRQALNIVRSRETRTAEI